MLPWGHAIVGLAGYLAVTRLRGGPVPSGWTVLALLFGTQFPDLVDKPLSWTLGLLPSGRSLAHSLLTAALVVGVLLALVGDRRRRHVIAFGFGYVTHSLGDAIVPLAVSRYEDVRYLVWPLLSVPTYERRPNLLTELGSIEPSARVVGSVAAFAVTLSAWWVARTRERSTGSREARSR